MVAKSIDKPESAGFVSMAFIGWAIGAVRWANIFGDALDHVIDTKSS